MPAKAKERADSLTFDYPSVGFAKSHIVLADCFEWLRRAPENIDWSRLAVRALRPGGHVFIATNAFIAQLLYGALVEGGLEFRGQLIRLVRTLRGGDRPKNAELEFPEVSSMPKGCYEP